MFCTSWQCGQPCAFLVSRGLLPGSTFPSATWDSPVRTCQERTPGLGEVMSMKVGRKALCGQRQITTQTFLGSLRPGSAWCCHAGGKKKPKGRAVASPPLLAQNLQTQSSDPGPACTGLVSCGQHLPESVFLGLSLLLLPIYPYSLRPPLPTLLSLGRGQ